MNLVRLFGFAVIVTVVAGSTIDNKITGQPKVECAVDSITVHITTQNSFEGHVYIKGHYDEAGCKNDATLSTEAYISVPFTSCGVRRQRSILVMLGGKRGELDSLIQQIRNVTPGIGESLLTTALVTQNIPMPTCKYEVLQRDAHGQQIRYASVGDQVYHRWSCASGDKNAQGVFCMTVHSCSVNNDQGMRVGLLDENGCATDKVLLNNLNYTGDLEGGQSTMVFKFADQTSMFFECQIRLVLKEGDKCVRSSDKCPEPQRGRRSADVKLDTDTDKEGDNVDVFSNRLTVFDIDDPISQKLDAIEIASLNNRSRHPVLATPEVDDSSAALCLSPISFGILIAVLAIVLLASLVTVGLLCSKHGRRSFSSEQIFKE